MNSRNFRSAQSGAVLIVGLVMLLLLTIIGIAAIRDSSLQERMAGNMRDRSLAFQASEAGLRAGEAILNSTSAPPSFTGSAAGYGPQLDGAGSAAFWQDFDWTTDSVLTTLGLTHVKNQPQYHIELVRSTVGEDSDGAVDLVGGMSNTSAVYRITSRAEGGSGDAVVILQSTYRSNRASE